MAFIARHRGGEPSQLTFRQLTFHRGTIWSARFSSGGHSILYSATWEGEPFRLYTTTPSGLESRAHDVPGTLLGVSPTDELALVSERNRAMPRPGTLALLNLAAGAPRELLSDVVSADWTPAGELAVIRSVAGRSRLELPLGHILYETPHLLTDLRISRTGDQIAFIDHPENRFGGIIVVFSREGRSTALTPDLASVTGPAWSPNGEELWFTDDHQSILAVTLSGRQRVVARLPGSFAVHDVARDGKILLARVVRRLLMRGRAPGASAERDLTWLDLSSSADVSQDGKLLLFNEFGQGGGVKGRAYVRGTDGSPPIKLTEGGAMSLSPDGMRAMLMPRGTEVPIVPVRAGEPISVRFPVATLFYASWFPDGRRILFTGSERPDGQARVFVLDETTGKSRPITEEGVRDDTLDRNRRPISPDGKRIVVHRSDGFALYSVEGGGHWPVPGLDQSHIPIGWTPDGKSLLVVDVDGDAAVTVVEALDLTTGQRHPWKSLMPPDSTGVAGIFNIRFAASGEGYVYTYASLLSELYLATGFE